MSFYWSPCEMFWSSRRVVSYICHRPINTVHRRRRRSQSSVQTADAASWLADPVDPACPVPPLLCDEDKYDRSHLRLWVCSLLEVRFPTFSQHLKVTLKTVFYGDSERIAEHCWIRFWRSKLVLDQVQFRFRMDFGLTHDLVAPQRWEKNLYL